MRHVVKGCVRLRGRHCSTSSWQWSTWGESDRHDGWRGSNWSGNEKWNPASVVEPASAEELQEIVRKASSVRALGSTHSFTPLVGAESSTGDETVRVSLRRMPRIFEVDRTNMTVTVDSGATYSEVCAALGASGLALRNTASLPQFSIAGAVMTGTHGSSGIGEDGRVRFGGLPDEVVAMTMVGPDGEETVYAEGDERFGSAVVSLGLLGVARTVTLRLEPDFDVSQRVYGNWPPGSSGGTLTGLFEDLPDILRGTRSFSAFLDWGIDDTGMLVLRDHHQGGDLAAMPPSVNGAALRTDPVEDFIEGGRFEATGVGKWHDKLHVFFRDGRPFGPQPPELQIEHFVPMQYMEEALEATRMVGETWGTSLLYSELRAVRGGGGHLLAPYCCGETDGYDTIAIANGFRIGLDVERVLEASAALEEALEPYNARAHWGKLSAYTPAQVQELYGERLAKFRAVREAVDPNRKFSNVWADRMLLDS